MHFSCILDPATNLLICHMIFVGNVQKSSIEFHLTGLDSSFKFCYKGPAGNH